MQLGAAGSTTAKKVYVAVREAGAEVIQPGEVCEWLPTATAADQGYRVQVIDTAINATTGIAARVAGVAETTISTSQMGRLQVYGVGNVRASASLNVGRAVVAGSINATNIGHVQEAVQTTTTTLDYAQAFVGVTLENGPNATNSTVMISVI